MITQSEPDYVIIIYSHEYGSGISSETEMALEGTHHVRVLRSALQKARKVWPRAKPRMEVRRHSIKLRWWGEKHKDDCLLDLTYESIKARPGSGLYELRIDDEIGGHENIRVIFLVPPKEWIPLQESLKPVLWIIEALPKKRDDWTSAQLTRFDAGAAIIKQRFYQ
jgi:hypothetical protein